MTDVEKLNLEKTREITKGMTDSERIEMLKVVSTESLINEINRRTEIMQRQIADVKKALGL